MAGRKVIRNGELSVRVEDYAKAARSLQQLVDASGGFVEDLQVEHDVEAVSRATWKLRVPAQGVDKALQQLRVLGRVTREHLGAQDVTEAHADLKARLDNAKATEARLRQLLDKPELALKDVLEVERELSRAREAVELLDGHLRALDGRVELATLQVELVVAAKYVPAVDPSLGERLSETLDHSLQALAEAAEGALLLAVAVLPWLLALALLGWLAGLGVRGWVRWWAERSQRRLRPPPPPPQSRDTAA